MVRLIMGSNGAGKTKQLIALVTLRWSLRAAASYASSPAPT